MKLTPQQKARRVVRSLSWWPGNAGFTREPSPAHWPPWHAPPLQYDAKSQDAQLSIRKKRAAPIDQAIFDVRSSSGREIYHVVRRGKYWSCTCKGFQYNGKCPHIGAAQKTPEVRNREVADWVQFATEAANRLLSGRGIT